MAGDEFAPYRKGGCSMVCMARLGLSALLMQSSLGCVGVSLRQGGGGSPAHLEVGWFSRITMK